MALEVRCRHCGSGPGEPCLTPAWPGKDQHSRRPLRFTPAHDTRIRDAAKARGYSEEEAERMAAMELAGACGAYRKVHPAGEPPPGAKPADPNQAELELGI